MRSLADHHSYCHLIIFYWLETNHQRVSLWGDTSATTVSYNTGMHDDLLTREQIALHRRTYVVFPTSPHAYPPLPSVLGRNSRYVSRNVLQAVRLPYIYR